MHVEYCTHTKKNGRKEGSEQDVSELETNVVNCISEYSRARFIRVFSALNM